jgi:hypothetical protein
LKLTDVIDNLFFIASRRADEAGVELAKVVANSYLLSADCTDTVTV